MTSTEICYAFITKLNQFLIDQGQTCKVYKSGIDFALVKDITFPLVQITEIDIDENLTTSKKSKIFTKAVYQLSFFTGPVNEYINTTNVFRPWRIILDGLRDIDLNLMSGLCTIVKNSKVSLSETFLNQKVSPSAIQLFHIHFIGDYVIDVPEAAKSNDESIIDSIDFINKNDEVI